MARWICKLRTDGDTPKIDAFIEDIKKVYEKHGLAIGHEDQHGAFEIVNNAAEYVEWLEDAHDDTG